MKIAKVFCLAIWSLALLSCAKINHLKVKDPITISSPSPTEQITKVVLDDTQKNYVDAGNKMAFRFLGQIYDGGNLICSPLSLQYALAMTANGASGETLQEIIDFLGYGKEGIDALNGYSKALLEQLPAVDLDVTLKVTDALLVNDMYPLQPSFQEIVEHNYYAAVDNMDFSDPEPVAARINEWADRNTNGFIDKLLDVDDVSADAAAYIMNALYFKAKWAGSKNNPMFEKRYTRHEDFHIQGGNTVKVKMMNTMSWFKYAEMDGYTVVALPYAGYKYFMYIILPEDDDISGLVEKLQVTAWSEILDNLKQDAEVYVKIPKFDVENKYDLVESLIALGVKKPFTEGEAEFDRMFLSPGGFWISKVIQKSKISVSEWGTEAGSVSVVEMMPESAMPDEPKKVYFYADHPFAFVIGEATSGTILFEGVFAQP